MCIYYQKCCVYNFDMRRICVAKVGYAEYNLSDCDPEANGRARGVWLPSSLDGLERWERRRSGYASAGENDQATGQHYPYPRTLLRNRWAARELNLSGLITNLLEDHWPTARLPHGE